MIIKAVNTDKTTLTKNNKAPISTRSNFFPHYFHSK